VQASRIGKAIDYSLMARIAVAGDRRVFVVFIIFVVL
jgi:hypothetical protein